MNKLAIEGGAPARSKPLPPHYPGATMIGAEEMSRAAGVLAAQSPFRYYGPALQGAVEALENAMAADLNVPYALGVSSGTAALIVAMKALGIGYGDKVIVPANTFLATPGAVVCCHAVPVFCDIDDSLNLDPADLERVYDDAVKAIIAVPILGVPVDMEPIMAFARGKSIAVIEDVAQSCGAAYRGRALGTIGTIGVFSFQMNKLLTAGEGGAVVTHDVKLFERAVRYHDQGMLRHRDRYGIDSPDDLFAFVGQNYRMSELAGAVLAEQWRKLPLIVGTMKRRHREIKEALAAACPGIAFRPCPDDAGETGSSLCIRLDSAAETDACIRALEAERIAAFTLYGGKPVYMQPALFNRRTAESSGFPFDYPFAEPVVYGESMCPRAVDLLPRSLFVPLSPLLTERDAEEIAEGIAKVYRNRSRLAV